MRWVVLALVATTACTADGSLTVLILYDKAPESDCTVSSALGLSVSSGTLDLDSGQGYTFNALVRNGASAVTGAPNQNVAIIEGADVRLESASTKRSEEVIDALGPGRLRTQYATTIVAPGGGTAVVTYYVVDPEQALALGEIVEPGESVQVIARSRVFGKLDGTAFASTYFGYPVTLCHDCVPPPEEGEVSCYGDQR